MQSRHKTPLCLNVLQVDVFYEIAYLLFFSAQFSIQHFRVLSLRHYYLVAVVRGLQSVRQRLIGGSSGQRIFRGAKKR